MSDRLAWSGKCNSVSLSTPTQVKCQSDLATSNSYFLSRFVLLPILFILIALLLTASSSFCTANGQFWFWKLKVAVDFVLQQQSKAKHHQGQPICHHPRWLLYKCRVVGQSNLWSTNGAEFNDQRAIEGKKQRGTRRENVTEWSFKVSVVVALVVLDQPQNCSFLQMAVAKTKPNWTVGNCVCLELRDIYQPILPLPPPFAASTSTQHTAEHSTESSSPARSSSTVFAALARLSSVRRASPLHR